MRDLSLRMLSYRLPLRSLPLRFATRIGLTFLCAGLAACGDTTPEPTSLLTLESPRLGLSSGPFSITDLGTFGHSSSAKAINSHGQILGTADDAVDIPHVVVWHNGNVTDLGSVSSTFDPMDINDQGDIVGNSYATNHAVLWERGTVTDLGTLGGSWSQAYAMNNKGQITGASARSDGRTRAFLWQDGVMTDLGTLGDDYSAGYAISEDGQVAGQSITIVPLRSRPFLWKKGPKGKPGTMIDLGTLGSGEYATANGVNNKGQVVGWSITTGVDGPQHAFFWDNGKMTDLGTLGRDPSRATAINDDGQVVGVSRTVIGFSVHFHGFIWAKGTSGLIDLGTGSDLSSWANDINSRGQVVGISTSGGASHAVLWTTR